VIPKAASALLSDKDTDADKLTPSSFTFSLLVQFI
jgi:hypothetical protein